MQERLGAPLIYSPKRKGYSYSDDSFELPGIWFNEDNIVALALAVRLATSIPDESIKQSLCSFLNDLLGKQKSALCLEEISEKISVKNIEYSKAAGSSFHIIADALFKEKSLLITYHSPHTQETTTRKIFPLHLLLYMGSWHIVGYCATRRELRDFVISRIRFAEPLTDKIPLPNALPSVKRYIRRNFGIMQGGKQSLVKLRFSPAVSGWVQEQVWHQNQKNTVSRDGSLIMELPVADFREIRRRILSYGADVKVLSPKSLAEELKKEIKRMGRIY
jgi:predicted DNA-binding transcriptional regulator YafY